MNRSSHLQLSGQCIASGEMSDPPHGLVTENSIRLIGVIMLDNLVDLARPRRDVIILGVIRALMTACPGGVKWGDPGRLFVD